MRSDQDKPFTVINDASDFAEGATLEQFDSQNNRRPVAFFSHSLNPAERNDETFERELLAIVPKMGQNVTLLPFFAMDKPPKRYVIAQPLKQEWY
jgi:hypothetical protein